MLCTCAQGLVIWLDLILERLRIQIFPGDSFDPGLLNGSKIVYFAYILRYLSRVGKSTCAFCRLIVSQNGNHIQPADRMLVYQTLKVRYIDYLNISTISIHPCPSS